MFRRNPKNLLISGSRLLKCPAYFAYWLILHTCFHDEFCNPKMPFERQPWSAGYMLLTFIQSPSHTAILICCYFDLLLFSFSCSRHPLHQPRSQGLSSWRSLHNLEPRVLRLSGGWVAGKLRTFAPIATAHL